MNPSTRPFGRRMAQAVIFVAKSGLYIAQQPDFIPVLISSEIQLQKFDDYMEWIFP